MNAQAAEKTLVICSAMSHLWATHTHAYTPSPTHTYAQSRKRQALPQLCHYIAILSHGVHSRNLTQLKTQSPAGGNVSEILKSAGNSFPPFQSIPVDLRF